MNRPTTTSETLKTRILELRDTTLGNAIRQQWPIRKTLNEPWSDDETALVAKLVDELDIEGPIVTDEEFQRVKNLIATLTDDQIDRVTGWVREAAASPGRELSLGGGWHTTRRVCLAEVCALWAASERDDIEF